MGQPRLTEFLLKLSTDRATLDKFKKASLRERRDLLADAGLSPEQQEAILSNNSRTLIDAVMSELAREASMEDPYKNGVLPIVLPCYLELHHCDDQ